MIELKDVSKSYKTQMIFNNFNLSISSGEKILLNAPSGKGKSTIFKFLMGFTKPDSGKIYVDKEELSGENIGKIRKKIAYVNQDITLRNITMNNLVKEVFHYDGNKHLSFDEEKYIQHKLNLSLEESLFHKPIDMISGGERQRMGLLLAILLDRPILLLDEVVSGLDKTLKHRVNDFLLSLDKTILLISHDDKLNNENTWKVVSW